MPFGRQCTEKELSTYCLQKQTAHLNHGGQALRIQVYSGLLLTNRDMHVLL